MTPRNPLSRRQFVKDAGGLLIGFSIADSAALPRIFAPSASSASTHAPANQLDSWLRIAPDGTIHVFSGKTEIGMGVQTAFAQIVAEELDVPVAQVSFVMGDTAATVDQGGVGGSTSVMLGAKPLRNAAATARFLLLHLASTRLAVPPDQLQVSNGIITAKNDASSRVSYADLAQDTALRDPLTVSGSGFALNVQGAGKPKDPAGYTIVGQSVPRGDVPAKVLGQFRYVTDIRVPGMLHARVIRPPTAGATLISIDDDSLKPIPGIVKVVARGNFVGVIAQTEWAAIRAAEILKISWTKPAPPFPASSAEIYQHMRATPPKASKVILTQGDTASAFAHAAKRVDATYEFPFQCHATMGPGCAVADVHADGSATIWSGSQKPHELQKGIADLLHLPPDSVRILWTEDAGSYGRPGFEDAAADAALLSQSIHKPVRVQWMRRDMTAWGTKGPAVICNLAAALDPAGKLTALDFSSIAFSGGETYYHPDSAGNFLAGQLIGIPNTTGKDEFAQYGEHSATYSIPNVHVAASVVPALHPSASPLRTSHLRDPEGPAVTFAVESFIDELAAAAAQDPLEFRLAHLEDPRAHAVLTAAAKHAAWDSRPSPRKISPADEVLTGRGIAFGTRRGTYVATIAHVEVHRRTGAIRVLRLTCAHDCGLIVNPDGLRGVIEANLIQSLSRATKEEVTFDRANVTSVDWQTYPVARTPDIPAQVDVILMNHPELPPVGAGEPASRPTAAAIANAIFDATSIRLRQAPLTQARIHSALSGLPAS